MRATIRTLSQAVVLAASLVLLAGCAPPPSAGYFGPFDTIDIGGPGHPGIESLLGVAELQAKRGDTVELVSASAVGASDENVTPYVLRLAETHGGIGGLEGDTFGDGLSFARYAAPLAGFTFTRADGQIQVVLRVTSQHPGEVAFTAVDLTFRVNGGPERTQRLPSSGAVCFGSPPPSSCP